MKVRRSRTKFVPCIFSNVWRCLSPRKLILLCLHVKFSIASGNTAKFEFSATLLNKLLQTCQFYQAATSLFNETADLLQFVESACNKPVDNEF